MAASLLSAGRVPAVATLIGLVLGLLPVTHSLAAEETLAPVPALSAAEPGLPALDLSATTSASASVPQAYLLSDLPRVLVLPQTDLRQQGQTFGRMVAFMEKTGLPRTRVPNQAELQQWLQRSGQGIERLTLGNNLEAYRLARFYNLARWQAESLTTDESILLQKLLSWRVLAQIPNGYVPGEGPLIVLTYPIESDIQGCEPCRVSEADSRAILAHEFQHAKYAADSALRNYTEWYWFNRASVSLRSHVLRFLERRGYDTTQQALVLDEFHAFLAQSGNGAWFQAVDWGLGAEGVDRLRQDFFNGLAVFGLGKESEARPPAIANHQHRENVNE